VDTHARNVVLRVAEALAKVESGEGGPDDFLVEVRGGEAALDNANREWKRLLFELSLNVDSALHPWPRPDCFDERAATMEAAVEASAPPGPNRIEASDRLGELARRIVAELVD
jgi:hypothetical protein